MEKGKGLFNFIEVLYHNIFYGFIFGLEIAWLLSQISWLDMRFKTEIFIPCGILIGFVGGFFALAKQVPQKISRSIFVLLLFLSLLTAITFLKNVEAAWFVVPILVRSGLGLKSLKPFNFWLLFLFLISLALLRMRFKSNLKR